MMVHGSTWQYKAVHDKFYHGLWQYMTVLHGSTSFILSRFMAVHCGHDTLQYMTGFPPARGGATGRFSSAFVSAALHALSVAIASSHCMHKLVYSSFGTLAPVSLRLGTGSFASWRCSRRCFGRGSCLASSRCCLGRLPRGIPGHRRP